MCTIPGITRYGKGSNSSEVSFAKRENMMQSSLNLMIMVIILSDCSQFESYSDTVLFSFIDYLKSTSHKRGRLFISVTQKKKIIVKLVQN